MITTRFRRIFVLAYSKGRHLVIPLNEAQTAYVVAMQITAAAVIPRDTRTTREDLEDGAQRIRLGAALTAIVFRDEFSA